MKTLNAFSGGFKKFANKKYIVPVLLCFIALLFLIERGPFGSLRIKELSGGAGILDMRFGYSGAEAYSLLDKIGELGRNTYIRFLGLDFLFTLVYMLLQSLLITSLVAKAKLSARWEKLNLLPLARCLLDIGENLILIFLLMNYPVRLTTLVTAASVITAVKLFINYAYVAIVFFLGALTSRQSIHFKNSGRKMKETR